MIPLVYRIAVLRLWWAPGPAVAGELPQLFWPDDFFEALFQDGDGWSLRDYWMRCTFGMIQPEFDLSHFHGVRFGDNDQATLSGNRQGMTQAARQLMADSGIDATPYHGVIAFVNPPPCNAGAVGVDGDAALDQNAVLAFYQHEIGHMLGFEHAYGGNAQVYADSYDVMGGTGTFSHVLPTPPQFASLPTSKPQFWLSERRTSAAALYRRFRGTTLFVTSGYVTEAGVGDRVWLAALSEVTNEGEMSPVLATIPVHPPGLNAGLVTLEYRTASGDDAGVTPAVVVHTIGVRVVPPGRSEVDPPWYEGVFGPAEGSSYTLFGMTFVVRTVATGRVGGVEVEIMDHLEIPNLHERVVPGVLAHESGLTRRPGSPTPPPRPRSAEPRVPETGVERLDP